MRQDRTPRAAAGPVYRVVADLLRQMSAAVLNPRPPHREIALGGMPLMTEEEQLRWSMLLERLDAIDPLAARILSLRFEEGLTRDQAAERLHLTRGKIQAREEAAVAWLRRRLSEPRRGPPRLD